MKYNEIKPCIDLKKHIHTFWELKGDVNNGKVERIFPDGCPGIVINLGQPCKTDNGSTSLDHGKTYIVGTMTTFKDSFIDPNAHLLGVCLKPASVNSFFNFVSQSEIIDQTIELEQNASLDITKLLRDPIVYINRFFLDRKETNAHPLHQVLSDINVSNGQRNIWEIARSNGFSVRQLQRHFKFHIGISPKEYSNIVRFQNALNRIRNRSNRSLEEIAFECGYYDHSHLTNEIKANTGLPPSLL